MGREPRTGRLPGERLPDAPVTDERTPDDEGAEEDGGAIGIFPSWGWVYGTIIVYTILAIALLHVFSVTFDYGIQ